MKTPRLMEHQLNAQETTFMLTVSASSAPLVKAHLESLMGLLTGSAFESQSVPSLELGSSPQDTQLPGEALKSYRLKHKYTQKALANKLGVASARISDMEQGIKAISPEHAIILSSLFNVPVSAFISKDEAND